MERIQELSLKKTIKQIKHSKINNKICITIGRTTYFIKCTVTLKVIANNPKCAICGAAAVKCYLCKHDGAYYISFYTEENGKLILLTKDHIIPRSQGGGNGIMNMQTCCEVCNRTKADTIIDNQSDSAQIIELKQQISFLKGEIKRLSSINIFLERKNNELDDIIEKLRSNHLIRLIEKIMNWWYEL